MYKGEKAKDNNTEQEQLNKIRQTIWTLWKIFEKQIHVKLLQKRKDAERGKGQRMNNMEGEGFSCKIQSNEKEEGGTDSQRWR